MAKRKVRWEVMSAGVYAAIRKKYHLSNGDMGAFFGPIVLVEPIYEKGELNLGQTAGVDMADALTSWAHLMYNSNTARRVVDAARARLLEKRGEFKQAKKAADRKKARKKK